jgi:hypothetical protein
MKLSEITIVRTSGTQEDRMTRSCCRLERRILMAFEQALTEGQMAVADHLLYALETLDRESGDGSLLADAYLSSMTARRAGRRRPKALSGSPRKPKH